MTPEYVAMRMIEGIESNRELVALPRYLLGSLLAISFYQVTGSLALPSPDGANPMQGWSSSQAEKIFERISN